MPVLLAQLALCRMLIIAPVLLLWSSTAWTTPAKLALLIQIWPGVDAFAVPHSFGMRLTGSVRIALGLGSTYRQAIAEWFRFADALAQIRSLIDRTWSASTAQLLTQAPPLMMIMMSANATLESVVKSSTWLPKPAHANAVSSQMQPTLDACVFHSPQPLNYLKITAHFFRACYINIFDQPGQHLNFCSFLILDSLFTVAF